MNHAIERRIATGRAEVRQATASSEPTKIIGIGVPFNVETIIRVSTGTDFRERILPGAFRSVIGSDVAGLFNHDPNLILGRTSNHTMRLAEDSTGLRYEIDVNVEDRAALDIVARLGRGDVVGSSFGFRVKRDEWTRPTRSGELPLRTIHEVAELVDVGPVTFPAYNEATAEARARAASFSAGGGNDSVADGDRKRRLALAQATAASGADVTVEDGWRRQRWQRVMAPRRVSDQERVARYRAECATLRP